MTVVPLNRALAILAILLGAGAAVGTPPSAARQAIDPITLATWIRERRAVRVVDLRDDAARAMFTLPTARPPGAPLATLAVHRADTVVFVDDGGGASADAALALRKAPGTVRWLRGGVPGWTRDVLNPTITEDAPDSSFARFGAIAELSRYFGGVPRILPAGTADTLRADLARTVRRGCGF